MPRLIGLSSLLTLQIARAPSTRFLATSTTSAAPTLTPTQKKGIRRAIAALPPAPLPPSRAAASGWTVYMASNFASAKAKSPEKSATEIVKLLSQEWKAAPESVKSEFETKAQKNVETAHSARDSYVASITPAQHLILTKRRNLLKKLGMSVPTVPRPPNVPKPPLQPFMAFYADLRKSADKQRALLGREFGKELGQDMKAVTEAFKNLPASEKEVSWIEERRAKLSEEIFRCLEQRACTTAFVNSRALFSRRLLMRSLFIFCCFVAWLHFSSPMNAHSPLPSKSMKPNSQLTSNPRKKNLRLCAESLIELSRKRSRALSRRRGRRRS